jgi:hypothetical protein
MQRQRPPGFTRGRPHLDTAPISTTKALESRPAYRIKPVDRQQTRWQHCPYGGTWPTQPQVRAEYAQAVGGTPPDGQPVVDVDAENEQLQLALTAVAYAEEALREAQALTQSSSMCGNDLDHLLCEASKTATSDTTVYSLVAAKIPAGSRNFLRPIHIGDRDAGHYVLLHVDRFGRATLYDSIPSYCAGQARAVAARLLQHDDIYEIRLPAQGTNECGFCVTNCARRILGVSHVASPAPGDLRRHYAPMLVARRQRELGQARDELQTIQSNLAEIALQAPAHEHCLPTRSEILGAPGPKVTAVAKTAQEVSRHAARALENVEVLELTTRSANDFSPLYAPAISTNDMTRTYQEAQGSSPTESPSLATQSSPVQRIRGNNFTPERIRHPPSSLGSNSGAQASNFTAATTDQLEDFLRTLRVNDRFAVRFRERQDLDGTTHPVCTWCGTVKAPWLHDQRCITVRWDPAQARARGLPHHALPRV